MTTGTCAGSSGTGGTPPNTNRWFKRILDVGSALVATPKISLFIELAACSHICPKDGHFVAFNFPNEQSVEEKGCQSLDLQRKRKECVQSCSNQFG